MSINTTRRDVLHLCIYTLSAAASVFILDGSFHLLSHELETWVNKRTQVIRSPPFDRTGREGPLDPAPTAVHRQYFDGGNVGVESNIIIENLVAEAALDRIHGEELLLSPLDATLAGVVGTVPSQARLALLPLYLIRSIKIGKPLVDTAEVLQ